MPYPKFNFVYSWLNKSKSLSLMLLICHDISTFRIVKYFSYYSIREILKFHLYVCYVFKSWQYTELYHYFTGIQRPEGRENNLVWVNHVQWEVWSAKGKQARFFDERLWFNRLTINLRLWFDRLAFNLLDNTMLNWIEYYIRFPWVCTAKNEMT